MVEDRVTDGKRVAQLLSSELSGRDRDTLGDVAVVDADPDAEPSPEGTVGYGVAYRDERVGTVRIYPDAAALTVESAVDPTDDGPATDHSLAERVADAVAGPDLSVTEDGAVRIESGAAVKRAVDALVAGLSDED
ncbi:hypothetical protein I7X12_01345 [Halosimplex litoreum]|uniref:DUF7993 domain-containing protein n=1 Tax=Halosimplex litoreum TaxID=1198301 RepID=A0A7T3FZ86_9EURY|nr:hypothetical protein [Halosimplex litoreum]QPV63307.1 hypothetical protein I7X12_01345 [Halosimplex litoreum]